MSRRYGRKQRRAHRQQIAEGIADRERLSQSRDYYQAKLSELEGRLREALGPETALTVTPYRREVEAFSARAGTPLRKPIPTFDRASSASSTEFVVLEAYVVHVEADPYRYAHHIRFFEVTKNYAAVAYVIDDLTLKCLGPSLADLNYIGADVTRQLLASLRGGN